MDTQKIKKEVSRFFSNPNTLTFIFTIIAILVLYYIYSYMVNNAVQPTTLYYATQTIYESEQITDEMYSTVQVSGSFVSSQGSNIVQNYGQLYNKYVAKGYRIPINSFFYTSALTSTDAADETAFTDLKDNYTIFPLDVDFHSTYGCSIMDGDYIDIFIKTEIEQDTGMDTDGDGSTDSSDSLLVFGDFVKSIQVLMVVNKDGEDVFTSTKEDEKLEPTQLYFAVPLETYRMLQIAQRGVKYKIDLVPVPRDTSYSENPEEPSIASEEMEELILSQATAYDN